MKKYLYEDLYLQETSHWWHRAKRRLVLYLINKYRPAQKLKILDVGCGTGKNVEVFSRLGEAWGIDKSSQAIKFCHLRQLKHVQIGRAETTGLFANSFNVLTLLDVLEHVEDEQTLKEMHRILKNNGIIIVNVPAFPWLWNKWDEVLHHKRRYTKTSLISILRQTGFKIKFISYHFSFLVFPVYLIRKIKSRAGNTYTSDFQINNPLINFLLYFLCIFEQSLLRLFSLPLGTSLICVAEKNQP